MLRTPDLVDMLELRGVARGLPTRERGVAGGGLLEREQELLSLDEGLAGARDGAGTVQLIEGPPGIGKTSLLDAASRHAERDGMRVLHARATELESAYAFGLTRQLFEPVLASCSESERAALMEGAAAFAGPAVGSPTVALAPEAGFAVLHGLYWLVANLARDRPVMLAVDDAQWADEQSLAFFGFLATRLAELAVALVLVGRTTGSEPRPLLAQLAAEFSGATVTPAPLSSSAVLELLRRLGEDPDVEFADACHCAVGGNPLLLEQLVAELRCEGIKPHASAVARIQRIGPRTAAQAMLFRIGGLPPAALALARAVAVLGDGAQMRHAARLARVSLEHATGAADDLARASVFAADGTLAFVHPIVREAVYQDNGVNTRAMAHRTAAGLLDAEGSLPERVASHLLLTQPTGDHHVVELLRAAAAAAVKRAAPEAAVTCLRRALAEPPEHAQRAAVLQELGVVEACVGDLGAIDRFRDALELTEDPPTRARIALQLAGEVLHGAGRVQEAAVLLERSLVGIGETDRELRLTLQATLLNAAILHPEPSAQVSQWMPDIGDAPAGETPAERRLLVQLALRVGFAGEPATRCVDLARRALGGGSLLIDPGLDPQSYAQAINALGQSGEPQAAHDASTAMLERAQQRGALLNMAAAYCIRSYMAYRLGRLLDAEADARDTLAVIEGSPALAVLLSYATAALVNALVEQGELEVAEEALRQVGAPEEQCSGAGVEHIFGARGRLRLAQGRAEEALSDLLERGRKLRSQGIINPAWAPWRSGAALAHLSLGEREQALALARDELRLARRYGAARELSMALRVAGLAEGGSHGIELLREAVTVAEGSPARLEHAKALVDLGAALRRSNQRAQSREPLRRGLELAHRCGAEGLGAHARTELAATGARPRSPVYRGVDALTVSESRAARIAADGLTNPQIAQALFVTQKTVEKHLANAYTKLGIQSRVELPAALTVGDVGAVDTKE